jgi:hypothetical protein
VAAFGSQIAKHTDRLQQASTRVEQLAHEEATLVQRQAQESTERIQRDADNQLAAVDARRQSITAQLTTVGELLQELSRAVGPDAAAGPDTTQPDTDTDTDTASGRPADAPTEVMTQVDVVEVAEHAFDHSADAPATADEPSHEDAGVRR